MGISKRKRIARVESMEMQHANYLKRELYERVSSEPGIFEFLQRGCLDGLWYWDLENPEHEWMNARFWELLGYDPGEKKHLAAEWQDLIHPDDRKLAVENLQKHLANPSCPYDQVVRYRHKSGRTVWVRCRGIAIWNSEGKAIRMLGAHNDLTELKELEEQLRRLSETDQLTGIANRRAFEKHFQWALKNRKRTREPLSLVLIDIDYFKRVNDTHGHAVGDSALVAVTSAVQKACRESDYVARWGGDELIVLLHDADEQQSLLGAERIREAFANIEAVNEAISASLGVATLPKSTDEPISEMTMDELISLADKALYVAKDSGRNRVVHVTELAV